MILISKIAYLDAETYYALNPDNHSLPTVFSIPREELIFDYLCNFFHAKFFKSKSCASSYLDL